MQKSSENFKQLALPFGPPAISVDVEDWPQSTWDHSLPITERAASNTRRVLALLSEAGVHATMFVLGKFAERFPEVVREIHAQGHEVASHGYGHVEIFHQSQGEFTEDIRRSKENLEQIIGARVRGYRAPDFSIVRETLWALRALSEAGFDYDSSIFPIRHARYGIPDWPVSPVRLDLGNGNTITECPIATFRWINKNWPVGGGGYHRLLPGFMTRYLSRRVMKSTPFVLYCHPYELDPSEFKEISISIPLSVRLHQGLGRRWFKKRLKVFLQSFGGQPVRNLLDVSDWPNFHIELPRAAAI
jgi:polysaccharide deacetylase family protein (PEP-CTERM system associated)